MPALISPPDGLSEIRMKRIGQIVVLAGKNGSGKSRLLRRIHEWSLSKEAAISVAQINEQRGMMEKTIESNPLSSNLPLWKKQVDDFNRILTQRGWVSLSAENRKPEIIYFVPKGLHLLDCHSIPPAVMRNHAMSVSASAGVDMLRDGALAYIQFIQDRWREATHQVAIMEAHEKDTAIADYEGLNKLLQIFLGVTLTRSLNSEAELFEFPVSRALLSDGQKILLQFCVAIHAQGTKLKEAIVLMDEPENHIHPSVMLDALNSIQKHLTDGQLWIATHSIPLLAHFEASSIWWMENGAVSFAGNVPRKVLSGLLGDEERILKTTDFFNLPSELAANRFAHQCLFDPEAIRTDADDPQTRQIVEVLKDFGEEKQIRILDYGAGRGRLAAAIYDTFDKDAIAQWLDYIAFDIDQKHRDECEGAITRIYGDSKNRYFNRMSELGGLDNGSFDAIIMCNVLHEIDPKDWMTLFSAESPLFLLLKERGFLLLVEDNELPVGEKPHQKGFLVLDTTQVKMLFAIAEREPGFEVLEKKGGRLKAHKIPRKSLANVDSNSRNRALKSVLQAAKENIRSLRAQTGTYQNGRLHGFWLQQLANSQLNLDEIDGSK